MREMLMTSLPIRRALLFTFSIDTRARRGARKPMLIGYADEL